MAEQEKPVKPAAAAAPAPAYEVGQVLTPEGLEAMRVALRAELASQAKADPTFSDPNAAVSLDVGLHSTLRANIAQNLKEVEVPKGAVAMFCATDQRVVTDSGHVFLFPANTVQHVPAAFVTVCRKAGCAEVPAKA